MARKNTPNKYLTRALKRTHYELWDWLYNNPWKSKRDWPGWVYNGGYAKAVRLDCVLCEIYSFITNRVNCHGCPLKAAQEGHVCHDAAGWSDYYSKWKNAKTVKTKCKYAKLIRDMVVPF